MDKTLYISSSPHVHEGGTTAKAMRDVIYALLPCVALWIYSFGIIKPSVVMALCIIGCMASEAAWEKVRGLPITIGDGSAAMTGILLALNMPPNSPWWMALLGGVAAIVIGKQVFGGLGYNPFNPALIGRTVLLISFPVQMTTWMMPRTHEITSATPLSDVKIAVGLTGNIPDEIKAQLGSVLFGGFGGQLGVVSGFALIAGGCYLIYRKVITWHIPVSFIGSAFVLSAIFWAVNSSKYPSPVFHLFTGGLMLGAFFMATDWVTTPITPKGMLIFGAGCGILTILIRLFGGYPEGVAFSILLMNSATPIIDRLTMPKKFGLVTQKG
ncbi:MAG: RnfABCDGE type electron transport complex subunit D [Deltaproteobacteria bacterium]|nr:RnfABCDGE type electron transport complex subunit D [Deltaproteobacteria bacterium]